MGLNIKRGTVGGEFEGGIFVRPTAHQRLVRLELRAMGASYKGTSHLIPEDPSGHLVDRLLRAAARDEEAAAGNPDADYRFRCEALEIEFLKRQAASKTGSTRAKALQAARDRIAGMSQSDRAALNRAIAAQVAERDLCRLPVLAGSVKPGDQILKAGAARPVQALGDSWTLSKAELPRLRARFPEAEALEAGQEVQFALWSEKALDPTLEPAL